MASPSSTTTAATPTTTTVSLIGVIPARRPISIPVKSSSVAEQRAAAATAATALQSMSVPSSAPSASGPRAVLDEHTIKKLAEGDPATLFAVQGLGGVSTGPNDRTAIAQRSCKRKRTDKDLRITAAERSENGPHRLVKRQNQGDDDDDDNDGAYEPSGGDDDDDDGDVDGSDGDDDRKRRSKKRKTNGKENEQGVMNPPVDLSEPKTRKTDGKGKKKREAPLPVELTKGDRKKKRGAHLPVELTEDELVLKRIASTDKHPPVLETVIGKRLLTHFPEGKCALRGAKAPLIAALMKAFILARQARREHDRLEHEIAAAALPDDDDGDALQSHTAPVPASDVRITALQQQLNEALQKNTELTAKNKDLEEGMALAVNTEDGRLLAVDELLFKLNQYRDQLNKKSLNEAEEKWINDNNRLQAQVDAFRVDIAKAADTHITAIAKVESDLAEANLKFMEATTKLDAQRQRIEALSADLANKTAEHDQQKAKRVEALVKLQQAEADKRGLDAKVQELTAKAESDKAAHAVTLTAAHARVQQLEAKVNSDANRDVANATSLANTVADLKTKLDQQIKRNEEFARHVSRAETARSLAIAYGTDAYKMHTEYRSKVCELVNAAKNEAPDLAFDILSIPKGQMPAIDSYIAASHGADDGSSGSQLDVTEDQRQVNHEQRHGTLDASNSNSTSNSTVHTVNFSTATCIPATPLRTDDQTQSQ